jgi:hypothetical protein
MTLASECEAPVTFDGGGSIKLEMDGDALARFADFGGSGADGGGVDTLELLKGFRIGADSAVADRIGS